MILRTLYNRFFHSIKMTNYREDWSWTKIHKDYPDKGQINKPIQNVQEQLLKYVKTHAQKGNLKNCIDTVDQFCSKHWMMNLGPEKAQMIKSIFEKYKPQNILQIGGYCGYSSLVFSYLSPGKIHTIEPSQKYSGIAKQIQEHAGVAQRNHISLGIVSTMKDQIQKRGPYDAILIDHIKTLYLSDFKLLEQYGIIKKGTIVIGDNIIYPGSPDYLAYFKESKDYDSTLYHSYLEYCNSPDAVLISIKL